MIGINAQAQQNNIQLSRDHLIPGQPNVDIECMVCLDLLDVDSSVECLECEKIICKSDYGKLNDKSKCPLCNQKKGFRDKVSRSLKNQLQDLKFECPN